MGENVTDPIALSELDGKLYPCPVTPHISNTFRTPRWVLWHHFHSPGMNITVVNATLCSHWKPALLSPPFLFPLRALSQALCQAQTLAVGQLHQSKA